MKLGMSLYTYGADLHAGRISTEDAIRHAASLGCDGIELIGEQHFSAYPDILEEGSRLRALTASLGMEILCYSVYLNGMLRWDRETTFSEYVDMAVRAIAATSHLGCRILRPAFYAEPVQSLIELVQACLPALESYDVIWGVELHAPFHPMHYKAALDAVASPRFRLIPDFSCWARNGLPDRFMDAGLDTFQALTPYMVHCHAKSHRFDENGEDPNTPYRELLAILRKNGFSGSVVCEYEGWLQDDVPYSSLKNAVRHFALLERYGRKQ